MDSLTLKQLHRIVQQLDSVKNIHLHEDSITFEWAGDSICFWCGERKGAGHYHSAQKEHTGAFCALALQKTAGIVLGAVASMITSINSSIFITSMIASNYYNCQNNFGTVGQAFDDPYEPGKFCIGLRSDIYTRGNASETDIQQQLQAFVDNIPNFEDDMLSRITQMGPDAKFLKQPEKENTFKTLKDMWDLFK